MSRLLAEARNPERWLAPLAAAACVLVCPALLLLFTPGLVLVPPADGERGDPLVRAVHVVAASLCFWMAAFWLLRWIPVPLDSAFLAVSAVSVAVHALRPRPGPAPTLRALAARVPVGALLAAGAVIYLRLLPMNSDPVLPGNDMAMHTYLTELIVRANGVPASYRPILPIDTFGSFPVGFHTISALVALGAGLPSHAAGYWVTCLSYAFLGGALYALVRPFAGRTATGIVAALVPFVLASPQGYIGWGGNPTVLAIALAALLFGMLLRIRSWRPGDAVLAGLLLSGLALTHTVVLVQAFYLFGLPLLGWLAVRGPRDRATALSLVGLGLVFGVVSAAYLTTVDLHALDPETRDWLANWVGKTDHAWRDNLPTAPITIPRYVVATLGGAAWALVALAAFGLAPLRRREPMAWALQLLFLAAALLLILNTQLWILPLSPLLYPERIAAMTILPLGLLGAVGLERLLGERRGWSAPVAVLLAAVVAAAPYEDHYLDNVSSQASVRSSDLRAFAWLDRHAGPDDVIVTQVGDAGSWIPGILFRPVTETHLNIAYLLHVRMPETGRFLYLGSRCIYGCRWSLDAPPDPSLWREVHADGAARVYERRQDAGATTPASGDAGG